MAFEYITEPTSPLNLEVGEDLNLTWEIDRTFTGEIKKYGDGGLPFNDGNWTTIGGTVTYEVEKMAVRRSGSGSNYSSRAVNTTTAITRATTLKYKTTILSGDGAWRLATMGNSLATSENFIVSDNGSPGTYNILFLFGTITTIATNTSASSGDKFEVTN